MFQFQNGSLLDILMRNNYKILYFRNYYYYYFMFLEFSCSVTCYNLFFLTSVKRKQLLPGPQVNCCWCAINAPGILLLALPLRSISLCPLAPFDSRFPSTGKAWSPRQRLSFCSRDPDLFLRVWE